MSHLYFERYAWKAPLFPSYSPPEDLELVVVIPAFNEPNPDLAIKSLLHCSPPPCGVLILVIVNAPDNAVPEVTTANDRTLGMLEELTSTKTSFPVLFKHLIFPEKKSGVGMARKVGMDEAARLFEKLGKEGIIACYDADCLCDSNYLEAVYRHFQNKKNNLGLVYYEHFLDGPNSEAITAYELYLRYYVDALRFSGYPFAFQTLGSCMTVRSGAYMKQGGMNTRKAGEDFYFIHKMAASGGLADIIRTAVFPSDRVSNRVPFGTGYAIGRYFQSPDREYPVYHPSIFEEFRFFLQQIPKLYQEMTIKDGQFDLAMNDFLKQQKFVSIVSEARKQSTSYPAFLKRFYRWMDGFKVLKFVHYARDQFYGTVGLDEAIHWLNDVYLKKELPTNPSRKDLLLRLRQFDRENEFRSDGTNQPPQGAAW